MKIIESSARRLELRIDGIGTGGVCALDRNTGEAEITRLIVGVPYSKKRVSLAQVSDITVKRPNERKTYYATLRLTSGEDITLGGTNKEDAMEAARAIRDFLRAKPVTS
jgi:hypothetical protein